MATEVVVPSFGLGWNSGHIAHWYSPDGATVSAGEPVLCVESDYVAFEVEAEVDGVVRHQTRDGEPAAGDVLALILAPGERLPVAAAEHDEEHAALDDDDPTGGDAWESSIEADESFATAPTAHGALAAWTAEDDDGDEEDFDFASALPTGDQEAADDTFGIEARVLPLRRQTLAEPPPVTDDESPWAPVIGDDLRVSEEWTRGAVAAEHGWEEPSWEDTPGEPPVKDPSEEASAYFGVAPLADGVTRAEDLEPSNWNTATGEFEAEPSWDEAEQVSPAAIGAQYVRVRADLREVHKMRAQLAREWKPVEPRDEDVVVRAVARVLAEADLSDSIALIVPERDGMRSSVVAEASSTPFRTAVEALAAGWEAPFEDDHAFDVVSFGEWGIDEGAPELRDGRPLALSVGAVRAWAIVEGDQVVPAPVVTLTLAYDGWTVTAGQAAWFLARVRELLEAPYALLAA